MGLSQAGLLLSKETEGQGPSEDAGRSGMADGKGEEQ